MHEVERLIRLIVEPGPQRGRDVRAWIAEATGYGDAKIRRVAEDMEREGVLIRGAWALRSKNATRTLRASLEARIPVGESPPSLVEALPEMIEREWRELRGETL